MVSALCFWKGASADRLHGHRQFRVWAQLLLGRGERALVWNSIRVLLDDEARSTDNLVFRALASSDAEARRTKLNTIPQATIAP